jgi:hypothetical protein
MASSEAPAYLVKVSNQTTRAARAAAASPHAVVNLIRMVKALDSDVEETPLEEAGDLGVVHTWRVSLSDSRLIDRTYNMPEFCSIPSKMGTNSGST